MTSALFERLRKSLNEAPLVEPIGGDDYCPENERPVPAAVLIMITDRAEPGMLLTVRRDHLRAHAGQIAFAGGRMDPGEDSISAALREAREEMGIEPQSVAIAGSLDPYHTVTGYLVTPVVATVPPEVTVQPNDMEVADWFEAPLDFLIDPAHHRQVTELLRGKTRTYYEIMWNGRRIWGVTAAMIVNLSRRLQWH